MEQIKLPQNITINNDGSLITLRCTLCPWEANFTQLADQKEIERTAKEHNCLPEIR